MFEILVVDDDPSEGLIVRRILTALLGREFKLDQTAFCSEAAERMNAQPYDLVLLDNRLTRTITARITVPTLRQTRFTSPIAIMTVDTDPLYLSDPSILGVDTIVDKTQLIGFLTGYVRKWQLRETQAQRRA